MALTNAMLKAMGIEQDQRDQIMTAHQETLDSIKHERDELRDKAAKVPGLERQVEELEANQPKEDWEAKYNEVREQFEAYKAQVADEKANAEKASLYRAMLKDAGIIDDKRIDAIMKVTDLKDVSVKDGKIDDADNVAAAIADEWGAFIAQTSTHGADVAEPPTNGGAKMTRDQILGIKDTQARQQAIADNIELFQ